MKDLAALPVWNRLLIFTVRSRLGIVRVLIFKGAVQAGGPTFTSVLVTAIRPSFSLLSLRSSAEILKLTCFAM